MLITLGVGLGGILLFLFIFWKKLKEDYSSDIIFKSAFSVLVGILIGWGIAVRILPSAFLWLSAAGASMGLVFSNARFKIRFYESLEAVIISGLPWISLVFLEHSVRDSSLISFMVFLSCLVFIFIYYYFDQHYKEYSWYKSGKIGFSGLAILLIIFASRLVVAIFRIPVISFFGHEVWADAALLIITAGILVNLGRKKK